MTDLNVGFVLASRSWLFGSHPFPHFICRAVFTAKFHSELSGQLQALLDRGLSQLPDPA
jgi:hypothetical protein